MHGKPRRCKHGRGLKGMQHFQHRICVKSQLLQCEADLPESLKFGKVQVSCEGSDGPRDSYVLKGREYCSLFSAMIADTLSRFVCARVPLGANSRRAPT